MIRLQIQLELQFTSLLKVSFSPKNVSTHRPRVCVSTESRDACFLTALRRVIRALRSPRGLQLIRKVIKMCICAHRKREPKLSTV